MSLSRLIFRMCWLGFVLMLAGSVARADQVWTVSVDTSNLVANYLPGPFGIDFELLGTDGNTVTLTNFSFGAGGSTVLGTAFLTNGASGDLSSSVSLNDGAYFFNDFNQGFTPGSTLTFTMDSTLIAPQPLTAPDNFSMVIYNDYNPSMGLYGTPITTTDPMNGNNTFFNFNIDGTVPPTMLVYSTPSGDVSVVVTASVPEPSSAVIMLFGVLGISGAMNWRRRPSD
jgi:hypothetical protein